MKGSLRRAKRKNKNKLKRNIQNLNTKTITECKASSAKNVYLESRKINRHIVRFSRQRERDRGNSRSRVFLLFFR